MAKSQLFAIVIVAVAAAVTSTVLVLGQGAGDPPKDLGPVGLPPAEVIELPEGTPAAGLTLPYKYGRFSIIAPGTAFSYCDATPPDRTRAQQVTRQLSAPGIIPPDDVVEGPDGRIEQVWSIDDLTNHGLFALPSYIPPGWQLDSAEAFTITWDDGSTLDSLFTVNYAQPGEFYIRITRFFIGADCQYEVLDPSRDPGSQHALTLSEIRGVPVVVQHQAPGEKIQAVLQVSYIAKDVVTTVESVAFDLDELSKMAEALIAHDQGGPS